MLPASRSVALLGESVQSILEQPELLTKLTAGENAEAYVKDYLNRPETHPKD